MAHRGTTPIDQNLVPLNGAYDIQIAIGAMRDRDMYHQHAWCEVPDVAASQVEAWNYQATQAIKTLPSSAAVISAVSDSLEDGAGTSTGALELKLVYLDANYAQQTETITLAGTTPATTTGTAIRLQDAEVVLSGSTQHAVGNITITIDGSVQGYVAAGQSEARQCSFTVPAGYQFIPHKMHVVTGRQGTAEVDVAFEVMRFGTNTWHTIRSVQVYQGAMEAEVTGDHVFEEKADIRALLTATATGVSCYVGLTGYMIRDGSGY